jgi:hypothetical protein
MRAIAQNRKPLPRADPARPTGTKMQYSQNSSKRQLVALLSASLEFGTRQRSNGMLLRVIRNIGYNARHP